jgi:predicted regulator of Ras-like GTPase activity (Roadblock/LC7/MglB family)
MARRQGRGAMLADLMHQLVDASPDFEGAVLVSSDGLVMAAEGTLENLDDSDVGAVATRAFGLRGETTMMLARGDLTKLILLGREGNMVITRAGPEALCVVLLRPHAKIGIASFEAERISQQIAAVLG